MARRGDALGVSGADTVIGAGVTVDGKLRSESDITIDGQLRGEVKTTGLVVVGINAEVTAPIRAGSTQVAGKLIGPITALGQVTIMATGHVEGDIVSAGLAIEPGGTFIGRSSIKTTGLPALSNDEVAEV
jgi:cytoskeletal protein CcmA (bactofilin family)